MGLLSVAVAPGLFLLAYLYLRDRYEREPRGMVLRAFAAGVLAVVVAVLLGEWVAVPLRTWLGFADEGWFDAFVTAGLIEELAKLAVVYLVAYRSAEWNEPFDGIVYAGAVALGFATLENILYVFGNEYGLAVGLIRSFTAVPGHLLDGIAMGYFLGLAKIAPAGKVRRRYWWAALLVPTAMHGLYDIVAFQVGRDGLYLLLLLLIVAVLARLARRKMRWLLALSPFRPARDGWQARAREPADGP